MSLFLVGTAVVSYLCGGFLTWLISAVEMLGDTSTNAYLDRLSRFSKQNMFAEIATFFYLVLGWPVHQLLKAIYK